MVCRTLEQIRGSAWRVVTVLAAALAVRLCLIYWFGPSAPPGAGSDHGVYSAQAIALVGSKDAWFAPGTEFSWRAPLEFVVLAGVMSATGSQTHWVAQCASALLGVLAAAVVYRAALAIGGHRIALFALWLRAFLPSFVVADTFVLAEPLQSALYMGAFVVLLRERPPSATRALFAGALLGCAALTREPNLVLLGGIAILLIRVGGRRHGSVSACLLVCGALVALAPWMVRNAIVWGRPLPIAYTSGYNLHIGNSPNTYGEFAEPPQPEGISWATPEFDRWHRQQAIAYIASSPAAFLSRGVVKLSYFAWPRFLREDLNAAYVALGSAALPLSVICGLTSAGLLLLGCFGHTALPAGFPRDYWTVTTVLMIGMVFITVGDARYRDLLDQWYVICAAVWLDSARADRSTWVARVGAGQARIVVPVVLLLSAWAVVLFRKLQ